MTRHPNPPLPAGPFALLLVEGGDERTVCEKVAGARVWSGLHCWKAAGRDGLLLTAELAALDPNYSFARSVGIVMDAEHALTEARELGQQILSKLGVTSPFVHSQLPPQPPRAAIFLSPDGGSPGCIETLCRRAVRNSRFAGCVDQLFACRAAPYPNVARADKAWLNSYFSMLDKPTRRFDQGFDHPDGIDSQHPAFNELRAFLGSL